MAACFTQRVTMLVDSPSSRATPYAVLPGSLHKRTTSASYSSVNVRRFPGGDLDIFFGIILTHQATTRRCPQPGRREAVRHRHLGHRWRERDHVSCSVEDRFANRYWPTRKVEGV